VLARSLVILKEDLPRTLYQTDPWEPYRDTIKQDAEDQELEHEEDDEGDDEVNT
jgi:hypothetical protein